MEHKDKTQNKNDNLFILSAPCVCKILLSALHATLISYIFVEDEVKHNRRTTSEKEDVNLSNESCSDVPQPNTNGEKAAASCQQHLLTDNNY